MSEKIDLFLINCPREATPSAEQRLQDQRMPLGIMYISSFVKQSGFATKIVDAEALCHGVGEIAALAAKHRPRIVGMNCHTLNRFTVYEIANTMRILLPDALLVLGGPHPSLVPDDTFMECGSIDVVVRGEGEQTMVDLLK
jgi:anaerobic magnesium-protoporphyrin IX monomethyl ester cyclase